MARATGLDGTLDLRTARTLSVDEYARTIGVGRHTVYLAVNEGSVPAIRLGRTIRIPASHVRGLLGIPEPRSTRVEAGR